MPGDEGEIEDIQAERGPAFFAYAANYLIDTDNAVIVDVEANRAIRQAALIPYAADESSSIIRTKWHTRLAANAGGRPRSAPA